MAWRKQEILKCKTKSCSRVSTLKQKRRLRCLVFSLLADAIRTVQFSRKLRWEKPSLKSRSSGQPGYKIPNLNSLRALSVRELCGFIEEMEQNLLTKSTQKSSSDQQSLMFRGTIQTQETNS